MISFLCIWCICRGGDCMLCLLLCAWLSLVKMPTILMSLIGQLQPLRIWYSYCSDININRACQVLFTADFDCNILLWDTETGIYTTLQQSKGRWGHPSRTDPLVHALVPSLMAALVTIVQPLSRQTRQSCSGLTRHRIRQILSPWLWLTLGVDEKRETRYIDSREGDRIFWNRKADKK